MFISGGKFVKHVRTARMRSNIFDNSKRKFPNSGRNIELFMEGAIHSGKECHCRRK